MSKADEALADVRRWLCDSLNDGDAGKVCGMLSVVSRRIAELESENAKLRDEIKRRDELEAKLIRCIENDYGILFAWDPLRKVWLSECTDEYVTERERLDAENAKLRDELDAVKHDLSLFSERIVELGAEHAKLRELVRELYEDQCCDGDQWKYRDRMTQLGVEVTDG